MKRRFKHKKRFRRKKLLYFITIIMLILTLNYIEKNITINLNDSKIIDILWKSENKYLKNNTVSDIYDYINDNIFNTPVNLLVNEFNYESENDYLPEDLGFVYVENKLPIIYIYNSHQGEKYSADYLEDYNIVPDVLIASNMLKDKLEQKKVKVYVENSNILEYMKNNNLNHAGSYIASRHFLIEALSKYPNAILYIDLHRDAVNHKTSTTTINGKECAKVMFVIGLENDTYENNLKITQEINDIIKNKYPTLTRGILKKEGYGVNGVYNQDLSSNIILIEVGGNENNIEEINNTLDLLAEIIGEYAYEKK